MKVVSENCGTAAPKATTDTVVDVTMKEIHFWNKRCVLEIDGRKHDVYLDDVVRIKKAPRATKARKAKAKK